MNILPKKNWHVLKKENIFKVKADIAKAKADENANLRKSEISNQETFLSILRSNRKNGADLRSVARIDRGEDERDDSLHLSLPERNAEHESEARASKEALEKSVGLLTYLGQSVLESRDRDELWWTRGGGKDSATASSLLQEERQRKRDIQLKKDDPLERILSFQDTIDKQKALSKSMRVPSLKQYPKEEFIHRTKKSKKHDHKKSKKHRHRKSSSSDDESDREKKKSKKDKKKEKQMEVFRAERHEREKVEKKRSEVVIEKSKNQYRMFPI